jgi:hypothetical protein
MRNALGSFSLTLFGFLLAFGGFMHSLGSFSLASVELFATAYWNQRLFID